jgi:hypothetical protein
VAAQRAKIWPLIANARFLPPNRVNDPYVDAGARRKRREDEDGYNFR